MSIFSGLKGLKPKSQGRRSVDRPGEWIVEILELAEGKSENKKGNNFGVQYYAAKVKVLQVVWENSDGAEDLGLPPLAPNVPGMEYSLVYFLNEQKPLDLERRLQDMQEFVCAFTRESPDVVDGDLIEMLWADGGAVAKGMKGTLKSTRNTNRKGKIDEKTGKVEVYHNTSFQQLHVVIKAAGEELAPGEFSESDIPY